MWIRWIAVSLFLLSFTHCATIDDQYYDSFSLDYPKELEEVHSLIIQKKYDDAIIRVEDYLNAAKNINWYGHAWFLKGFLFEMKEDYAKAISNYREAIQHASEYDSKVEAKALYNLSFVYERTKQMDELLTSLVDLMKRRQHFDILTGQVEIPARLAAAYAQKERIKEAMIFHREAANNYDDMIRRNRFRAPKSEISKSLYYLGLSVYDPEVVRFSHLARKLKVGQKYYLASAEAFKGTWADKSVERLLSRYDMLWLLVNNYKPNPKDDIGTQFKRKQEAQLVMASQFYDLVHELRVEEFPLSNVNRNSKKIMDATGRWLATIEGFAQKLDLGPGMIRDKPIKNTRLAKVVEKKEEPEVRVNKEKVQVDPVKIQKAKKADESSGFDPQPEIGQDPNL